MALQKFVTETCSVKNINALSDAALMDLIEKNRRSDGHIEIRADGWDKLSKDERAGLAARLLAQQLALAQSPTVYSRPLDVDQLDARLREVSSSDEDTSSQAQRSLLGDGSSRSPTPFVDIEAVGREAETDAYNNLVKDGGRPLYPIALLDEVSRNAGNYADLLRPWLDRFGETGRCWWNHDHYGHSWEVFQKQWGRWQDFRTWQRDNRWLEDDDGGYPAYAEEYINNVKNWYMEKAVPQQLAMLQDDPSIIKDAWESKLWHRRRQQRYCREHHGGVQFSDYVNAVKRRLASHGFVQPIHLQEDLKQQDDLATWIEYLCFEYWWLDRYTRTIDRLKPDYDKGWQKLVDKKLLRPHETQEFILTAEFSWRIDDERKRARETKQKAKMKARQFYASTQLDPNRLSIPKPERIRRLREAAHELLKAKAQLKLVKERGDSIIEFVRSTSRISVAKRDAARHRILLSWILAQVPLITAKLDSIGVRGNGSHGTESTKRKIHSDDYNDDSQYRAAKQRKLDRLESGSHSDQITAVTTKEEPQQQTSFITNEKESPLTIKIDACKFESPSQSIHLVA